MAESEEELKSLLMKMKEESEKAGLQLNIPLIISIIGTAFGVFFGHLIEFGLDKVIGGVFGVQLSL